MPVYNEQGCIASVVDEWSEYLSKEVGNFQFVILNDGSKDQTSQILDSLKEKYPITVIHKENQGHGPTIYRGYQIALNSFKDKKGWIFQIDSDGQFIPQDFLKLWSQRNDGHKIFIGQRKVRNDPFHRRMISFVVRLLTLIFFGVWGKDLNIPYRLMASDFLNDCLQIIPSQTFAPNIFISIIGNTRRCIRDGIEVTHKERNSGKVSIANFKLAKVCLKSFKELLLFRFQLMRRPRHASQIPHSR